MAQLNKQHQQLINGEGKCSCPMWIGGLPGGFCESLAYGKQNEQGGRYIMINGAKKWLDGRYDGYVGSLACPVHGGPTKKQVLNLCDYCTKHIAKCDGKPEFGTGKGNDNVYECVGVDF